MDGTQLMVTGAWDTAGGDRGMGQSWWWQGHGTQLMVTGAWDTAGGDRGMGHSWC